MLGAAAGWGREAELDWVGDGVAAVTEAVVTVAAAEEDEVLERSPRAGIPLNDKYTIADVYVHEQYNGAL